MGRRKRRRKIRPRPRRRLPKIFQCPRCGETSVSVIIDRRKGVARVVCSSCGLQAEFEYNPYLAEVDYYSKFLDAFEEGRIGVEEEAPRAEADEVPPEPEGVEHDEE